MTRIFLLFENEVAKSQIDSILLEDNSFELMDAVGELEDILTQIHHFSPDVILIENCYQNYEYVIGQIKSISKNQNTQIILLVSKPINDGVVNFVDGFVEYPLNNSILLSTIDSHSKIKKSLDRLHENNKELSRSLYQLNVLYNTSSRFTGTLNTTKLYEIMIEAMEKTLSFDISSVLIVSPNSKPIFNLNTMYEPSENLVNALKIRSVLNYRTQQTQDINYICRDFEDVEIIQKTKQSRSNKVFGIEAVSFDSLFAPIKIGEEFFGVVELFRQTPFLPEDVTCFQAITHQVALPLRSAKLYEEISITNKKLEKLEKIKSEFVSIVSHELRTPLTPINNSLEIVLQEQAGPISDDAKNFIVMAKRNIQRLSGIIEDLLDLSRIQTGKLDLKFKTVDITSSLELLQRTFLQVANEKNININLSIKEKLPEIYADIRRIEQIFSNLVSNALKFTPTDGSIDLNVKLVSFDEIDQSKLISPVVIPNGKYIKISVSDNGIGIKKEDIPKIFDKFSQIESSLKRNNGGVGLGLTITKQLIDSHLGLIEVKSEEQQGSTFSVYLPLSDDKKIFTMNLSKTLINYDDVGIIRLRFKKDINLIERIKENKLLNLSKLSAELILDENEYSEFLVYIPKISITSFDALYLNLNDFCSKNKQNEYDIIISGAHSAKDGIDAINIIRILTEG